MSKAYYLKSEAEIGKIIELEDATKSMNGNLYCASEECRASKKRQVRVSYVEGHYRDCNESQIFISPYFKLSSGKDKHHEHCQFNTKGRMKIIAQNSKSEVLESLENDKYEFRLHVIHNSLKSLSTSLGSEREQVSETDESMSDNQKTKEYINRGSLSSYLLTTKQIVELRAKIEEEQELSSLVKLKFEKVSIRWKNFYYEFDRFIEAFYYLSRKGKGSTHPVCFQGHIWKICEPKGGYLRYHSIKLKSKWITDEDNIKSFPSPEFIICDNEMLEGLSENIDVVIYSRCWIKDSPIKDGKRYLNIYGNLYHLHQICKVVYN